MKKYWLILIGMLLLSIFSVAAEEDLKPYWHTPIIGHTTKLLVTTKIVGNYEDNKDLFVVKVTVKNIGKYPAIGVFSQLKDIPATWKVKPSYQYYGFINPKHSKTRTFIVQRDDKDATIYAMAKALNARIAVSEKVAIPISIIVGVASLATLGILAYRYRRR